MLINKKEFLSKIYESVAMQRAMQQLKSKKELESTKAIIDEVIGNFFDNFLDVASYVEKNSEELKKVVGEEETSLITDETKIIVDK